ncbi:hypothetical protein LXA43DRAFT_664472 [Ganoderma leucocontextum]|nr:hypothetical protein LXA43DRAFT_664472 [Ganoderma leucocontextum]
MSIQATQPGPCVFGRSSLTSVCSNSYTSSLAWAYTRWYLEEVAMLVFDAMLHEGCSVRPSYCDSIVQLNAPPKLKWLSPASGWVPWSFLDDLAKLLLEPGMQAPLEALDLPCVTQGSNPRLTTGHHDSTETRPSRAWAPIIASVSQTLRHCALGLLAEECFPANLADLYGCLKQCARLQLLGLVCNIYPARKVDYLPFLFVDMLADVLSSESDAHPPFPQLETLSLELLQARKPIFQGCADACRKLGRALEDRTRYLHLKRLDLHPKMWMMTRTDKSSLWIWRYGRPFCGLVCDGLGRSGCSW